MRLGKKMPPYPVLNKAEFMSSYKNSSFNLVYDLQETARSLILKGAKIETDNDDLIELLKSGRVKGIVVVESSSTIYRETFEVTLLPKDIEIPLKNVDDKVEVSCFVYANENISNYSSKDLLDLYKGYSFELEKYSIFAADDGKIIYIAHDDKEDNKTASIFSVIKSFDPQKTSIKIELLEKKIKIVVPEKAFDHYDALKDKDSFRSLFFTILAIPALTYAFNEIQKYSDDTEIEEIIDHYRWFASIAKRYKTIYKEDIGFETFKQLNSYELAQTMMQDSPAKAIDDFYEIVMNVMPDETEEDSYE